MAVINNLNQDQDDNQQSNTTGTGTTSQSGQPSSQTGQPISVSGSAATGGGGTAANNQAGGANNSYGANTSSGRFNNLNNYLNANKDFNAQGGGLAGQVTNTLQDQSNGIQNQLNNDQQNFQSQADASHINYNPNVVDNAIQNAGSYANDPNNVSQFQSYLNANYTGPTSLANAGQIQNKAQTFSNTANLANSESGRFSLLNQLYGTPTYNQGQQSLDNLVLQSNPQQLQQLQQAGTIGQNLLTNVNNGVNQAATTAQQYAADNANTAAQTQTALGSAINQFGTIAQQQAQAAKAARDAQYAKTRAALSAGNVSADQASKLGLNANVANLYGVDPLQYLQESQYTPTAQNVISNDQYNQIQGLSKLAGNYLNGNPTQVLSQYSGPSQAGQFAAQNPYSFNAAGLNQAVASNRDTASNQLNSLINSSVFAPDGKGEANFLIPYNSPNGQVNIPLDQVASIVSGLQQQQGLGNSQAAPTLAALQKIIDQYGLTSNKGLNIS